MCNEEKGPMGKCRSACDLWERMSRVGSSEFPRGFVRRVLGEGQSPVVSVVCLPDSG